MTAPTLAIVTRDFSKYSETFVKQHTEHLFSGRTAIVAFKPLQTGVMPGKPFHLFPNSEGNNSLRLWLRSLGGTLLGTPTKLTDSRKNEELINFLHSADVTHVLCEFGYVAVELALPLARSGIPVFSCFRGNDASQRLRNKSYVSALRNLFPHLSGVIAVSQFLLDQLAAVGLKHPNSVVIPSGTDTRLIMPRPTEENHLLSVGRLVPKKDPLTALEAFARVARRHDKLRWTIVGSGPLENELRARAERLGLIDRIVMRGILPHERVIELMCRATAYFQAFRVAPNGDTEGMPSVIQEAMAAGRAIVTTRHAGIPEHVEHGKSGLLYREGDVEGLAEGLNRVVSSADLRRDLGAAARAYAVDSLDYRKLYKMTERFLLGSEASSG